MIHDQSGLDICVWELLIYLVDIGASSESHQARWATPLSGDVDQNRRVKM